MKKKDDPAIKRFNAWVMNGLRELADRVHMYGPRIDADDWRPSRDAAWHN